MAGNDFISEFAKKSTGYKLAVLGGIMLVSGVLFYQFRYSTGLEEKESLERRRTSLITKRGKLDQDLEKKQRLEKEYEELQRSIRDNERALPTESELPALFDHLQQKAGDAGVTIRKWKRVAEKDVDIYIRVPVEIEVTGTFYNIVRYFSLLGPPEYLKERIQVEDDDEEKRIDERIVSIENVQIVDPKLKDGEVVLTAKFVAATFRQPKPDKPADKGGPKKATTPGGKVGEAKKKHEERTDKAANQADAKKPGQGGAK